MKRALSFIFFFQLTYLSVFAQTSFFIKNTSAISGDTIAISVEVEHFIDIVGFQFSINWDPTVAEFINTGDYTLDGFSETNFSTNAIAGELSTSWFDNQVIGQNLPNGNSLFTLYFNLLSACDNSSMVSFTDSPLAREVIHIESGIANALSANWYDGQIEVLCPLSMSGMSITHASCEGIADGAISLNVSGGQAPYSYVWSNGSLVEDIESLTAGDYNLIVFDANQNTIVSETFTIFELYAAPIVEVETSVSACGQDNGSISIETFGSGDISYQWAHDANLSSSFLENLAAGEYMVTISDINTCAIEKVITIEEISPTLEEVSLINDDCAGIFNTATAVISGGMPPYDFMWSTGETDATVSNLPFGENAVSITDANGCMVSETILITPSVPMDFSYVETAVSCPGSNDGTIDLILEGGVAPYTFEWSTGDTSEDLFDLSAGTYNVIVTDANGCAAGTSIEVDAPASMNLTFSITPANNGNNGTARVYPQGGTPPYQITWGTGETSYNIDELGLGEYEISVTDANGCSIIETIEVGLTATSHIDLSDAITVFPNPTSGVFNIELGKVLSGEYELSIQDTQGKIMHYETSNSKGITTLEFNFSELQKGLYILKVEAENNIAMKKIVLQ